MDEFFPPELGLPEQAVRPASRKQLEMITRTARFLAGQSLQMEIVVKAKQASNGRFHFLDFGHRLNPFYKHLLARIREGYSPVAVPVQVDPVPAACDSPSNSPGAPDSPGPAGSGSAGPGLVSYGQDTSDSEEEAAAADEDVSTTTSHLASSGTTSPAHRKNVPSDTTALQPNGFRAVKPKCGVTEVPPLATKMVIDKLAS